MHRCRGDFVRQVGDHVARGEVVAIGAEELGDLVAAMAATLPRLEGSYAILVIAQGFKEIVAARKKSPLVIGLGDRANLAASDVTPLLEHTERMIFLEDGDMAAAGVST